MILRDRRGVAALAFAWLGVVGWLTLRSDPAMREIVLTTHWYCIVCGIGGATDVILNLILFLPFGLLARAAGWPFRRLVLAAFALTLSIELIQGNFLIGRDATLGDVLANTTGAAMGWALVAGLGSIIGSSRRARVAALIVLACQCLVWVGTGFGMRPTLDGPPPWVGRFRRVGNGQDPFEGTLQRVLLDGIPVTMEPMDPLPAKGDSLTLGIALTRTSAVPPRRSASIVRLVDGTPRAFLRVSQVRQGITVEVHMPASSLRFRTPSWRFSNALDIPLGTPWQYEWRWHATNIEMISRPANAPGNVVHDARAMSIGLGWSLVHPFVYVIDERAVWWTALWVAAWFALLGWISGFAGGGFAGLMTAAGVMLFVAAGQITSLPVTRLEIAATLAGFATGWALSHVAAPRPADAERGAEPARASIRTG